MERQDADGAPPLEGWARYAVYAAPSPETALGALGREWLGYDPERAAAVARPRTRFAAVGMSDAEVDAVVDAPARYGFHGTLKAPFRLRGGAPPSALDAALAAYAAERKPTPPMRLAVGAEDGFVALRSAQATPELDARAAEIVERFDAFRAPLTDEERARRRADALPPAAADALERWGYPWVMALFRFHLTLTRQTPPAEASALAARLAPIFDGASAAYALDGVALFADPGAGPFRLLRRYPFTG